MGSGTGSLDSNIADVSITSREKTEIRDSNPFGSNPLEA
jgi:hypothetical protein